MESKAKTTFYFFFSNEFGELQMRFTVLERKHETLDKAHEELKKAHEKLKGNNQCFLLYMFYGVTFWGTVQKGGGDPLRGTRAFMRVALIFFKMLPTKVLNQ